MAKPLDPPLLTVRGRTLDLSVRTYIMGILNATPDSFSDGGRWTRPADAVRFATTMVAAGADIIDIGGESTRPGGEPIDVAEELRRTLPVVRALREAVDAPISIDTTKASVAAEAITAGADMVNDVSALQFDPEMAEVVARCGVPIVLMHSRGEPRTLHHRPAYDDVGKEVVAELEVALERALDAGIRRENVILDPGVGFAKAAPHSVEILARLREVVALGCPVLVGVSRKSFLGALTGRDVGDRLAGTIAAAVASVLAGAHIVRVHDVAPVADAVRVADAIAAVAERG